MKLNRQEKEIVRRKFCTYCIKVLHGEALNYLDELDRQREAGSNFFRTSERKTWMLCTVVMSMIWQIISPYGQAGSCPQRVISMALKNFL